MHEHEQAEQGQVAAQRTARAAPSDAGLLRAAAAGRPDVLGTAGLLRLQRAVGNEATGELLEEGQARSPVLDVVGSGGGQPLEPAVRADMEARLGSDFGDVRVHTDTAASESARAVGAHAYTVGSDVVFQRDRYDPSSDAGRTMLAHELTHVVQQRQGPVDGTETGTGIRVSDPGDRFEREAAAVAEKAMAGPAPQPAAAATGAAVQRDEDEDDDALQGAFVQREEALEEDEETSAPSG